MQSQKVKSKAFAITQNPQLPVPIHILKPVKTTTCECPNLITNNKQKNVGHLTIDKATQQK